MCCACATPASRSSASHGIRSPTRSTGTARCARRTGTVNALGLFDLDRRIRPVGQAFQKIVAEWGDVLPTQSVCLRVPVYPPRHSRQGSKLGFFMQRDIEPDATPTAQANSDDDK